MGSCDRSIAPPISECETGCCSPARRPYRKSRRRAILLLSALLPQKGIAFQIINAKAACDSLLRYFGKGRRDARSCLGGKVFKTPFFSTHPRRAVMTP